MSTLVDTAQNPECAWCMCPRTRDHEQRCSRMLASGRMHRSLPASPQLSHHCVASRSPLRLDVFRPPRLSLLRPQCTIAERAAALEGLAARAQRHALSTTCHRRPTMEHCGAWTPDLCTAIDDARHCAALSHADERATRTRIAAERAQRTTQLRSDEERTTQGDRDHSEATNRCERPRAKLCADVDKCGISTSLHSIESAAHATLSRCSPVLTRFPSR